MRRALAPLVLTLVAACASEEERTVDAIERMADVFAEHRDDCDALAADLDAVRKANPAVLTALAGSEPAAGQTPRFDDAQVARMAKALEKMVKNAGTCGKDPRVAEVLGAMQ